VPNRASKFFNNSLRIDEISELFFAALEKQKSSFLKIEKRQRQRLEKIQFRGLSNGIELARFTKYQGRTGGSYE
jgi:hypothetical protein